MKRLTILTLVTFASLAEVANATALEPCDRQDLPYGARCGTVTVPLNYDAPELDSLDLKVIILPARGDKAPLDPVFYLVGGPGTAATETTSFFSDSMMYLQETHEIVLFDLRGTGESGDFHCSLSAAEKRDLLLAFRMSETLERCAQEINGRESLRTTVFAHDIDRVRQAIGAEKINLMGASYGTRLALEYARLYPDHLRASVLRGVSSPAEVITTQLLNGAAKEFAVLTELNPGLSETYAELAEQLETEPVTVRVGSDEVTVDRVALDGIVRFLLYDPRTAQSLPAIVTATTAGELGPLTQVVNGVERIINRFSIPVLLGVVCAEDVPFWSLDANESPFATSLLRDNAVAACQTWSVQPVATAFRHPVTSQAPTLLMSGDHDPATPANIAEKISESLPNSLHLVAPGVGHFPTWTSCYASIVAEFFDSGCIDDVDVSCVSEP